MKIADERFDEISTIYGYFRRSIGQILRPYSSGSTFTIDAPWLLPIQSVPGLFESSI